MTDRLKMTRRTALAALGTALAAPVFLRQAHAAEVTLKLHHFLPAMAPVQKNVFEPWAKELAEASNGAIEVQIYPAMQLGGKAPQLADQARQGIVDIAWTLPVYTPDRFPVAETMALPFMVTDAEKTSVAMDTLMREFGQDEYKGMKPLAFHTHAGGKLHTRDKGITSTADMAGMRLRAPNQSTGEMLTELGAEVVFFPVTEMVVGLSNGVIDGCCLPFEVVPAYKLQELTSYSAMPAPGARGIYTNTFSLVMNERAYEAMPEDARKVLDDHSGPALSKRLGASFDQAEAGGEKVVREHGNEIVEIPADVIAEWRKVSEPIVANWQKKLDDKGYDGAAIIKRANALLDQG
ncbi:TRAP transporter substrate-binding protein [Martelella lutilitoris]|uniref:TRAP transporter substrate-binding protein n=1 Tax=Martelella lutilitoris TaxID=2583532 RepID=A0A7T7HJ24_9HYPH|nr:TRAP transporter substrate-binding protein [Martelella lutilitoris]QQM30071.1 TRAP transporter substrate-binding protein [Martelella lutilitoris]